MFFKYEPGVFFEEPPPRPVYARVDQIEPVDDADDVPSLVLLDCIDADWLNDNANRARHLSDLGFEEADRRISVIAILSDLLGGGTKGGGELAEWYRLELGEPYNTDFDGACMRTTRQRLHAAGRRFHGHTQFYDRATRHYAAVKVDTLPACLHNNPLLHLPCPEH